MAVEDKKIPYELLVRFDGEGKPAGAHVLLIRRVSIDGELLKEEILPAEPITLEDFPTNEIMTQTTKDALAKIDELQTQVRDLIEALAKAEALAAKASEETED